MYSFTIFGLVLPPFCFRFANLNFGLSLELGRQISLWTQRKTNPITEVTQCPLGAYFVIIGQNYVSAVQFSSIRQCAFNFVFSWKICYTWWCNLIIAYVFVQNGDTALHLASYNDHPEVIHLFLKYNPQLATVANKVSSLIIGSIQNLLYFKGTLHSKLTLDFFSLA